MSITFFTCVLYDKAGDSTAPGKSAGKRKSLGVRQNRYLTRQLCWVLTGSVPVEESMATTSLGRVLVNRGGA